MYSFITRSYFGFVYIFHTVILPCYKPYCNEKTHQSPDIRVHFQMAMVKKFIKSTFCHFLGRYWTVCTLTSHSDSTGASIFPKVGQILHVTLSDQSNRVALPPCYSQQVGHCCRHIMWGIYELLKILWFDIHLDDLINSFYHIVL